MTCTTATRLLSYGSARTHLDPCPWRGGGGAMARTAATTPPVRASPLAACGWALVLAAIVISPGPACSASATTHAGEQPHTTAGGGRTALTGGHSTIRGAHDSGQRRRSEQLPPVLPSPWLVGYVNALAKWWPPEAIAGSLGVPGYEATPHGFNVIVLGFWTTAGPVDAAAVWANPITSVSQDNPWVRPVTIRRCRAVS